MTKINGKGPEINKTRRSISTITNMMLGMFIVLIFLIISFTYKQLKETESSFKAIAIDVVPTLANNGILHSQLSSLAFLVANFAQADSPAQMRISQTEVSGKLSEIERLVESSSLNITSELTLIRTELEQLDKLLNELFELEKRLKEGEIQIFQIQTQIAVSNTIEYSEKSKLLFSALALLHSDKLIEVRILQQTMNAALQRAQSIRNDNINADQRYFEDIELLVFGESGIINSKLALLRAKGRVEGQKNFVRRLVLDVASDAEFSAYDFASNQSNQAELLASQSSQRFFITLVTNLVTFLIGLGLIIFVKLRVVSRLEVLTQSVAQNAQPENIKLLYKQNDEISVLAKTIVQRNNLIDAQKAELTKLSFIDSLTQVGNRRAFNQRMEQAISLASRNKLNLSVLLIDVDCFKQFNDEYGHVKGDECLHSIAQHVKNMAKRSSDFVARFGGEEFVCLLVGMPSEEVFIFAKNLCTEIEALKIIHEHSQADSNYVTVSIGVHTEEFINSRSEERLLQCADTALYQAKTKGRNRAIKYLS